MSTKLPAASVMYAESQRTFVELARSLNVDDLATAVPCLPGWSVRDVLSHVWGVADDSLAGRTDGAPGEVWTASQIERHRHLEVGELLDRWTDKLDDIGALLDDSYGRAPAFDCQSHEHDIRHALDRGGNRANLVIGGAAVGFVRSLDHSFSVTVELNDGTSMSAGDGADPGVSLRNISAFELFRSRLGRRSRSQVEAYEWAGRADAIGEVVDSWFVFGPAEGPIDE